MKGNIYYSIKLVISGDAPVTLFAQQERNELFISAHGRLCGLNKMAHLDTSELASEFMEAYLPRFRKRYGQDVSIDIVQCSYTGQVKRTQSRIKQNSEIARKRIETGVLASNQTP